jgi:hypothetical protein
VKADKLFSGENYSAAQEMLTLLFVCSRRKENSVSTSYTSGMWAWAWAWAWSPNESMSLRASVASYW